jgi:hypothetical protein
MFDLHASLMQICCQTNERPGFTGYKGLLGRTADMQIANHPDLPFNLLHFARRPIQPRFFVRAQAIWQKTNKYGDLSREEHMQRRQQHAETNFARCARQYANARAYAEQQPGCL